MEAGGKAPLSSFCAWSTSWSTAALLQSLGTPPGSAGLLQVTPNVPDPLLRSLFCCSRALAESGAGRGRSMSTALLLLGGDPAILPA